MRRTILKRHTGLKLKSDSQKIRDALWQRIKFARVLFLVAKFEHALCEYCGRPAWGNELGILDAHHLDFNHRNNTEDNAYICHRVCHSHITLNRIKVKQLGFEGVKNGGNDE